MAAARLQLVNIVIIRKRAVCNETVSIAGAVLECGVYNNINNKTFIINVCRFV